MRTLEYALVTLVAVALALAVATFAVRKITGAFAQASHTLATATAD